jgi:7,8-dihydropterin-6-yl-methyl-4-(beta-D-ribofuranosyl)aminobenzene 5'-phosphate synthase
MIIEALEEIDPGNVKISVLTTNEVNATLLSDEKLQGKVIQPRSKSIGLIGEHGLALLIEVKSVEGEYRKILFDTGGFKATILNNSDVLKLNFAEVATTVISHGHFDHTGALHKIIPFLKSGSELIINPICFHLNQIAVTKSGEDIPLENFEEKVLELKNTGKLQMDAKLPQLNRDYILKLAEDSSIKIVETSTPLKLFPGIVTSGEIELFDLEAITKGFYILNKFNEYEKHTFRDETALYINIKDHGLIVITGCGHSGIINTIKHGQKITGINKIYAVIGGFHEEWSSDQRLEKTFRSIKSFEPEVLCGFHCTGFPLNVKMKDLLGHTLGVAGTEFYL